MGEALLELANLLNSKEEKMSQMTPQEGQIFIDCKNKAIKGFALGGSIATGLTWLGTRKLNNFLRVSLAGGAGFMAGMSGLKRSIDSSVNQILEMKGTRMQQELQKIVVEKYGSNPQRMKPFSKHFYVEEVMDDSAPGNPRLVYRPRNVFAEHPQIANRDTNGVPDANKSGMYHQQRNEDKLRTNVGARQQVHITPAVNMGAYGDPLEVLFGYSATDEESPQPDDSTKPQTRSQRRAHHKHRLRHRHRELSPLEEA